MKAGFIKGVVLAVSVMALVENQNLMDILVELLSGIAFAKTLVDVNCAAGAALEDLKVLVGGI